MNKITLFVVFNCVCLFLCGATLIKNASDEVKEALRNGARAKIVFIVTDEYGNPISNATGEVFFSMYPQKGNEIISQSDTNGIIVAENMTIGEIQYTISKDGYYGITKSFHIIDNGIIFEEDITGRITTGEVLNGNWLPYGITNRVILRRKNNPVPMIRHNFLRIIKDNLTPIGYDMKIGDFVSPYGKGEITDFTVKLNGYFDSSTNHYTILTMTFTNALDGAYIDYKNNYNDFKSSYNANTNILYGTNFIFEQKRIYTNSINTSLTKDCYMVLRTRTQTDQYGNIYSCNYSKIYGALNFGRKYIQIISFFNATTNSISIEYDGANQNLKEY